MPLYVLLIIGSSLCSFKGGDVRQDNKSVTAAARQINLTDFRFSFLKQSEGPNHFFKDGVVSEIPATRWVTFELRPVNMLHVIILSSWPQGPSSSGPCCTLLASFDCEIFSVQSVHPKN